jgi:hypothetical protein
MLAGMRGEKANPFHESSLVELGDAARVLATRFGGYQWGYRKQTFKVF